MSDPIAEIFKRARALHFSDLEDVAGKCVRRVSFKALFSSVGVAPLSGADLRSGKKYDIHLSGDLEENPDEQVETFIHELVHIWLLEEAKLEHRDKHEDEISRVVSILYERGDLGPRLLLEKFLES